MKRITKRWIDLYVSYLKRIPERHYFPIFVILSLYFVVPYSEFVVTALAPLYFIFEKQVRWVASKLPLPNYLRIGGSVIFFIVMMDDYLFYFALIALIAWSAKQVKKEGRSIRLVTEPLLKSVEVLKPLGVRLSHLPLTGVNFNIIKEVL